MQARAALAAAEHRLQELQHGPRTREIDEAEAALAGAASTLHTQQQEFSRVESLVGRKLLSASRARPRPRHAIRPVQPATRLSPRSSCCAKARAIEQLEARAMVEQQRAALAGLEASAARYLRTGCFGRIEALPYKLGERPPDQRHRW
ncbi:MAG: hypothetical protein R3E75_13030 [Steroidobacteraceae bacterium]